VAVSESEAAEVRAGKLVSPDRLVTIPNGIDTAVPEPADLHALLGVPAGTRLVGTIGRLAPQKAPEVFVGAAAEIGRAAPDVHFVLIGDGPLAPEVTAAVAAAGLGDRFHRVPFLEQASRYLPSLEVFTLTSRFEGGPYAPLEAMRASRPVVLTDVTGSRDTVDDGRTGFLVPPEAPSATAAAVIALLANPERAAAIGAAGRAALEARFDVRTMAAANAALYEQLRTS
jgi:glycosyltransferase involved in cell wall biosynthesis